MRSLNSRLLCEGLSHRMRFLREKKCMCVRTNNMYFISKGRARLTCIDRTLVYTMCRVACAQVEQVIDATNVNTYKNIQTSKI